MNDLRSKNLRGQERGPGSGDMRSEKNDKRIAATKKDDDRRKKNIKHGLQGSRKRFSC